MLLISTTTSASATNTGNITIEAGKRYLVTMLITNATASHSSVFIRFNSSSNSVYWYGGESVTSAGTPTVSNNGGQNTSEIALAKSSNGIALEIDASGQQGFMRGHFQLDTTKITTTYLATLWGQFIAKQSDASIANCTFSAHNVEDLTISDFELVFSQNVNATIIVYEFADTV